MKQKLLLEVEVPRSMLGQASEEEVREYIRYTLEQRGSINDKTFVKCATVNWQVTVLGESA